MRTRLIAALRAAANEVEQSPDCYDWYVLRKCNCGIVAKHLTGAEVPSGIGTWTDCVFHIEERCKVTGLPLDKVVDRLMTEGMTKGDFVELELLGNRDVLWALGVSDDCIAKVQEIGDQTYYGWTNLNKDGSSEYTERKNFISYARKWADMMEQGVLP